MHLQSQEGIENSCGLSLCGYVHILQSSAVQQLTTVTKIGRISDFPINLAHKHMQLGNMQAHLLPADNMQIESNGMS